MVTLASSYPLKFGNNKPAVQYANSIQPSVTTAYPQQQPVVHMHPHPPAYGKSPVARTMAGLKNAAGPMAWTGLWSLLAIKGTVFCCGLLGWPFILPAALSAGKAYGKFKEGYNRP
jgi:hypothetical protein